MSTRIKHVFALTILTTCFLTTRNTNAWFSTLKSYFVNTPTSTPAYDAANLAQADLHMPRMRFEPVINVHVKTTSDSASASTAENTSRQNLIDSGREHMQQQITSLSQLILRNKLATAVTLVGASYIATQATILYLRQVLANPQWWSQWHRTKAMTELYSLPQKTLAKQLLSDIQHTYTRLSNPLDFTTPLVSFVRDLEAEIKYLNLYKSLVKNIELCKLNKVIWFDSKLLEETPERLNRLAYIKSTFFTWLIDHKIETQKPL